MASRRRAGLGGRIARNRPKKPGFAAPPRPEQEVPPKPRACASPRSRRGSFVTSNIAINDNPAVVARRWMTFVQKRPPRWRGGLLPALHALRSVVLYGRRIAPGQRPDAIRELGDFNPGV